MDGVDISLPINGVLGGSLHFDQVDRRNASFFHVVSGQGNRIGIGLVGHDYNRLGGGLGLGKAG